MQVLRELESDGLVVQHAGLWRLSKKAERKYGKALRELWPIVEEEAA